MTASRIPIVCMIILILLVSFAGCIKPPENDGSSGGGDSGGSWFGGGGKTTPGTSNGTKGTTGSTATPTVTPVPNETSALIPATPFPVETTTPSNSSFTRLQELPPDENETPYVAIYYDTIPFKQNRTAYTYQLERPPLVIEMCIKPNMTTRTIWYERNAGEGKTQKVTTISPAAWFEVTVRDQATGSIVAEEGFAKTYSVDTGKKLILRSAGTYLIEFGGNELSAEIQMRVPKTETQTGQPVRNLSCSM